MGVFGGVASNDSQARICSAEAVSPPGELSPLGVCVMGMRGEESKGGIVRRGVEAADAGAMGLDCEKITFGTSTFKRGRGSGCEGAEGREGVVAPAVAGRTRKRRLLLFRCEDNILSTATDCSEVLSCEVTGRKRTGFGGRDAVFALASHMLMAERAFSGGSSFEPPSSTRKVWVNGALWIVGVIKSVCEESRGSEA